ncbi:unnamed protein product [Prorocentrum cordatum]|uniref:Uncharacterized protein n=1 Tax=Prorocentrum cordatum TaxID=2364126 RepID=A0ABN9TJ74_9DINO|nr:unnamed protein product [Polarella glacialis]
MPIYVRIVRFERIFLISLYVVRVLFCMRVFPHAQILLNVPLVVSISWIVLRFLIWRGPRHVCKGISRLPLRTRMVSFPFARVFLISQCLVLTFLYKLILLHVRILMPSFQPADLPDLAVVALLLQGHAGAVSSQLCADLPCIPGRDGPPACVGSDVDLPVRADRLVLAVVAALLQGHTEAASSQLDGLGFVCADLPGIPVPSPCLPVRVGPLTRVGFDDDLPVRADIPDLAGVAAQLPGVGAPPRGGVEEDVCADSTLAAFQNMLDRQTAMLEETLDRMLPEDVPPAVRELSAAPARSYRC